jgi:hypothetical protein
MSSQQNVSPELFEKFQEFMAKNTSSKVVGAQIDSEMIDKLRIVVNNFKKPSDIEEGDIVIWKQGMKNKKYPKENQPAYVLQVHEASVKEKEDRDSGTPYFMEPLNLQLAFIDDDGDLVTFYYDKRRFKIIAKNEKLASSA